MFIINKSYNFTTLAPSILGASFSNMKVRGIVTIDEAVKHADVVTKHESVRALIPGLPVTPNNLVFIIFVDTTGNIVVLAQDYVDPPSILLVTTTDLSVRIFNVDSSMEAIIKLRLKELGIANFTVTTV
ncbi:MAG: hypothetical protein Q9M11_03405 [Mariprofundaceae bacterium]|nr:hypothetical protein [Mariprofundaceae bacterium]